MITNGNEIQIEQGNFLRVHNAIIEALTKAHLAPLEFQIVMFLLRKTYGFNKKNDVISISQFMECGATRAATHNALMNLIRLKVILRNPAGKQTFRYGFNKYIEKWSEEVWKSRRPNQAKNFHKTVIVDGTVIPDDTVIVDGNSTVIPDGNGTVIVDGNNKRHTKDTSKDNIKKDIPEHKIMFGILAEISKVDMKLKAGQIAKVSKMLLKAEYTVDDVKGFSSWWYKNDWRGQKGQPPMLQQIVDGILQYKSSVTKKEYVSESVNILLPGGEITRGKT